MAFPHSGGISGLGGRAGRRVGGAPLETLDAPENLLIEAPRQGFSGMLEKPPSGSSARNNDSGRPLLAC
jgi:hypothetical protein